MEHKCITFFRQRVIIRTKQAIIKMNYSTTRGSGFKSRYTNTIFLKNNQSLIRVHFPIATASEASDTDFVSIRMESMRFAGNDFAVPKAPSPQQYPFYLVRFYSSTNIQILNSAFSRSTFTRVLESATDPTNFAFLFFGIPEINNIKSALIINVTKTTFEKNNFLSPIFIKASSSPLNVSILNCSFLSNNVTVAVALIAESTQSNTHILFTNTTFLDNKLADTDALYNVFFHSFSGRWCLTCLVVV